MSRKNTFVMRRILSLLGLQLAVQGFLVDDPCTSPKVLGNSLIRESSNQLSTTSTLDGYLCDDVTDGWYRFEDDEVSTSCVDTFHCSRTPIWMNDSVPTVKDGVQLKKFCVNTGTASDCCGSSFHTEVKNCGLFRVYNLNKINIHCPMAYCTDYTYRCQGNAGCNTTYPTFSSPTLIGPKTTGNSFTFTCDFRHAESDPSAVFDVMWKFDNQTVRIDTVAVPAHASSIDQTNWSGHLGQELSCSVRSYFTNLTQRIYSPEKESSPFLGGITVNPSSELTLMEGQETQLTLTSSLPILCSSSSTNCSLSLRLVLINNETLPGTDLLFDSCGIVTLDSSSKQMSASVKVSMPTNLIGLPAGRQIVRLEAIPGGSHSLWTGQIGQDIVINTIDVGHNQCTIFGDGNIDGFNKTALSVNVARQFTPGDYIMYRDDIFHRSDLQIQARMHIVKGDRTSLCGVAVLYGGEVVTIDMCSKVYNVSAPYLTSTKPDSKAIGVYMCDSSYYMIYTADDVSLEVRVHEQNIEVNLQLPPSYSSEGLGLCSYSSNTEHPLILSGSREKAFKLSATESFFAEGKVNLLKNVPHNDPPVYCRCEQKVCSTHRRITDFIVYLKNQCTAVKPKPDRLYHDWDTHFDHEAKPYTPPTGQPKISFQEGYARCKKLSEERLPYMCMHGTPLYFPNKFRQACFEDIVIENTTLQDLGFLQAFFWSCQHWHLDNRNMYIPDKNTGLLKPTPVLSTYICPNFCSLHGQCEEGKCHCDRHYTGKDCSMTIWAQPEILDVVDGNVCGGTIDDCSVPLLITRNILDGVALMATVVPISFRGLTGVPLPNTTHSTLAVSENKYSVSVNISQYVTNKAVPVTGFQITLLASGKLTNSVTYIIADSTCLTCSSENLTCTVKSDKCFFDNQCFYDGDRKPPDFKLGCDPTRDQQHWTPV